MSAVGIFWFVPSDIPGTSTILADMTPLAEASEYAGLKTHDRGHYEFWSELAESGSSGLRAQGLPEIIATTEYETFPRGRIVYDPGRQLFTIYADRRLHKSEFLRAVQAAFGISPREYRLMADQHYAKSKSIPPPSAADDL
jgi:hypothetical protein